MCAPMIACITLSALAEERRSPRLPPPPAEELCLGYPVISGVEVLPVNVWAPAGKDVAIEISGVVAAASYCEISSVSFSMESDNGIIPGDISLGEGGRFEGTVMVNLSKDGKFKEGTTYIGMISALDTDGHEAKMGFGVTVLHDRGKKVGLNK